jgi:tRNA-splicing ligase RtcB
MGDISVIVRGAPIPEGRAIGDVTAVVDIGAIGSAPHGAGRVMSRTKAAGKMKTRRNDRGKKVRYRDKSTAAIDWDDARARLLARGITVLGAGADESPGVYKPLTSVLQAHENVEILRVLRPIGVVMASPDTHDPYKD